MGGTTFPRGGIHPRDEKHRTAHLAVEPVSLPERLFVPLSQHIGAPAKATVARGDRVLAGQVIGIPTGFVSVPIHAPSSGTVRRVEAVPHPLGNPQPAVEIEVDGDDAWVEPLTPIPEPREVDPADLRRRVQEAGVVGLGGATFPTHVKLSPPPEVTIDRVILNGVECEPYLTADHRLMLDQPDEVLDGLAIVLHLFGLERGHVGIERNKPDAIEIVTRAAAGKPWAEVVPLEVKYPQGAEKQLIRAVTGREVPSGALPMAVGAVVQNVSTAAAIHRAVTAGTPLVERVATVTGLGVAEPKNLRFRVGTPIRHLIERCGGLVGDVGKVILGGPMMGLAQHTLDVPAIKGTSGVLCLLRSQVHIGPPGPCIRCGRCGGVCPMGLMPTEIVTAIGWNRVEDADRFDALDCIECGSCSFVCPASIPLVQSIRHAKGRVMAHRRKGGK